MDHLATSIVFNGFNGLPIVFTGFSLVGCSMVFHVTATIPAGLEAQRPGGVREALARAALQPHERQEAAGR